MMIIADSGSTKADWLVYNNDGSSKMLHTQGFNPFFHSSEEITTILKANFKGLLDQEAVQSVYYYGAGCSDQMRCDMVAEGLQPVFPNAVIEVEHDLTASARATCGTEPGIACILGTGSNSCYYNGKIVEDHVSNLGYLLGDEGSGSHMSKELLRCYFYREMPDELGKAFQKNTNIEERAFLNTLYSHDSPNTYLASFAKLISENKYHPFIQNLVSNSIGEFLDRHVCKYPEHLKVPVHFVGSIAHYFQDILQLAMDKRNLKLGVIIRKPIEPLLAYHIGKKKILK